MKLTDKNLQYAPGVDYEYDDYYCHGCYGCESGDDYCRGKVYEGLRVKIDLARMAEGIAPKKSSVITRYAVERLLSMAGADDPAMWDISAVGGYYGEEIDEIRFRGNAEHLQEKIEKLIEMSEVDQINFILGLEYGFFFKPISWARMEKIEIKDIFVPNKGYLELIDARPAVEGFPVAVVKVSNVEDPAGYSLVDGYHRFKAAKDNKERKIDVLVVS